MSEPATTILNEPTFCILNAGDPHDRATWIERWEQSPMQLPYAHPDVAALMVGSEEQVLCATLSDEGGTVLYAFIHRPLYEGASDIASPYGYGGALFWDAEDPEGLAARFWPLFDAWARSHGVVSEFVRSSLFPDVLDHPGKQRARNENFVRELETELDAVWSGSASKVRQNVRKAMKSGLSVQVDRQGSLIEDFHRIYTNTMIRHNSSQWYRFPLALFAELQAALGDRVLYVAVLEAGEVVSVDLTLLGRDTAYYFLGGTNLDHGASRPNDLVKATVMDWLALNGYRSYVLGGGVSPGDGLERYKRGFAPQGARTYCTTERIHDPHAYDALVAGHRYDAEVRGAQLSQDSDFFPHYRMPLTPASEGNAVHTSVPDNAVSGSAAHVERRRPRPGSVGAGAG